MLRRALIQSSVACIAGAFFLYRGHTVAGGLVLFIAASLAALAAFAPPVYETVQSLLVRLGRFVSTAIGTVLLSLLYYSVFTLGALYLRATKKDPLNRAFPGGSGSNWIVRASHGQTEMYSKQYSPLHDSAQTRPAGE